MPGLEVAAYYQHASPDEVGGDFYDLFPLADGRWALFLGDVCGKGAEAAAVTSLTRYTLRSAAVYDPDPVAVLGNLNSVLHQEEARFCTVIFGLLTPRPRRRHARPGQRRPPAGGAAAGRRHRRVPVHPGGQPVGPGARARGSSRPRST